jgi:hypothetical protein
MNVSVHIALTALAVLTGLQLLALATIVLLAAHRGHAEARGASALLQARCASRRSAAARARAGAPRQPGPRDSRTGGGARGRVQNGRVVETHAPHHFLPGVQAVEYLRAFTLGRLGWNLLGGNLIISGAFLTLVVALALGAVDWPFAVCFALVAYGYGLLLSMTALLLEELAPSRHETLPDRVRTLGRALLEPLGYRQLTVVWRIRGMARYLLKHGDWGTMTRRGLTPEQTIATAPHTGPATTQGH